MPVRIRKTFTLFPGVKVNVNKGGMSITVGRKGFHLNFSKRGVRQTTSLAGSGISHTSYLFKDEETENCQRTGFLAFVLIALFFIYFGANAFGLLSPKSCYQCSTYADSVGAAGRVVNTGLSR